ncbi:MAG: metal-dependent hydrolase [Deltaproteobacteria bacterium]|nr:metal-dependent hydrolase [Deltaproteobacteria bacterium]
MPPLLAPAFALLAAFGALGGDAPAGTLTALAVGALAPDVDLLLLLVDPARALRLHRGPTHTVVGLAVAAVLAGLAVAAAGGPPPAVAVPLAAGGTLIHASFDAISTHGLAARLSSPRGRKALPLLVPLDPLTTVIAVVAVLVAIAVPGTARVLSLAAIGLLTYLILVRAWARKRAWAAARTGLATPIEGIFPRPESPMRWTAVTRTAGGISAWIVDLGRRRLTALEPLPDAREETLAASRVAREFVRVSPFPVVRRRRRERGEAAELRDLRFAYEWPAAPFGADVDLDADGALRRERAYL